MERLGRFHGFQAVVGGAGLVASHLEEHGERRSCIRVVVDYEDSTRRRWLELGWDLTLLGLRNDWQPDHEAAAGPGPLLNA